MSRPGEPDDAVHDSLSDTAEGVDALREIDWDDEEEDR